MFLKTKVKSTGESEQSIITATGPCLDKQLTLQLIVAQALLI